MDTTCFNARKKEYKSLICAIATDEKVKLRIVVPRSMGCSCAKLAVCKDGETTVYYNMFWAGMCGNDHEYWQLHFYATTSGLYFYHFELETPWGKTYIKNSGNGIGDFNAACGEFQQTVYDKSFKTPDFLKGGIIYQIFPDRFYCSGTEKKNVPQGRVMRKWGEEPYWNQEQFGSVWNNDYFGGDLKGIEQKLPYIKSLGVSCIYLNPVFAANSNHRYDTADYEKIDSLLGTEQDFKSLCAAAKQCGIAIVLDGVFSHTGCDSKYFNLFGHYPPNGACDGVNSPYYSWYKFKHYPDDYESWWGIKLLPEVHEENPSYREYICGENGILRKWLRCGASGWRLDVADELPDIFLDDLRTAVKAENPDAVIIGEVWEDATNKFAYGKRRRYLLGEQLDSVMNYPFADAVLNFVKYGSAEAFENSVMSVAENYPPCVLHELMNHIGTHDTMRAITFLAGENAEGKDRAWQEKNNILSAEKFEKSIEMLKMASFLQFTLPGVPSIYYGDEVGMQGMKDPFNRACYPWGKENKGLYSWYKRLGEIRRGCSAFVQGELVPVYAVAGTVAYERRGSENAVLAAVNNSESAVEIFVGTEWDNSYSFFDNASVGGKLVLEPKGMALLSRLY